VALQICYLLYFSVFAAAADYDDDDEEDDQSICQSNHGFLDWPKYVKHCQVHCRQCVETKCQISRMSGYD